MQILGIILVVLGFIILQWTAHAISKPTYDRPLIFFKTVPVIIIHLLWITLLGAGLYCLWQVNYWIVVILVGGFFGLWFFGFCMARDKIRAKRIIKIYKHLSLYLPKADEQEVLKETAELYFKRLHWDGRRIKITLDTMFDKPVTHEIGDIKELVKSIFIFDGSSDDFVSGSNFMRYLKKSEKREKAIEKAYDEVIGEKTKVKERPTLSKDTTDRMMKEGFNPDEMTNEQLAALESLEKTEKYHWFPKLIYSTGCLFGIWALISLFILNLIFLMIFGMCALISIYSGYRIQRRIAGRRFYQASIRKYAYQQRSKVKRQQEDQK